MLRAHARARGEGERARQQARWRGKEGTTGREDASTQVEQPPRGAQLQHNGDAVLPYNEQSKSCLQRAAIPLG
jgi:hypothetical protein